MRIRTTLVALALPLLLAGGAFACTPPSTEADAAIASLIAEYEKSGLGYDKAYEAYRDRFTDFAAAHRGTEAEVRALLWLIQQTWWLRKSGTMEETSWPLAADLIDRHADSPQLAMLAEYQYVFGRKQRPELFATLIEVSPHASVKAAAHLGLARLEPARNDDGEPNEHYALLLNEFADETWRLSTYGAIADAFLNPHPAIALEVGQLAPEIVGVDPKGNPMRLSDFRGKVVMLDFWGHW